MNSINEKDMAGLPRYVGNIHPNCDYHHGQIETLGGVTCIQAVRANRSFPKFADGTNTTYKHAPNIVFFKGRFYLQYLVGEVDEHQPGGFSVIASAGDDLRFGNFQKSFPEYRIPECTVTDYKGLTHSFDGTTYGFMHQRMSFYISSDERLLVLGFYGWSPEKWMTNWDNYGIGRVVREMYADGTMSDIFFIKPNYQGGWNDSLLNYPLYHEAKDEGFVKACEELLANKLYTQQWAEENGDADDVITIKHPGGGKTYQAFNWYHISEDEVIGLWKHSFAAKSKDGGNTWGPVTFVPSLVMSGQKIWGEKLSDGTYALIYDPTLETQHRYPLCIVSGTDGYSFDNMRGIHGEVPEKRYAGFWKDYGPQYMRGICERTYNGHTLNGLKDIYMTYSVNKEDIWVCRINVPLKTEPEAIINGNIVEDFKNWHIYKPFFAECGVVESAYSEAKGIIEPISEGKAETAATGNGETAGRRLKGIALSDREPVDRVIITRPLKTEAGKSFHIELLPKPLVNKPVFIELCDEKHIPAVRILLRENGIVNVRTVTEIGAGRYVPGEILKLDIEADCESFSFRLKVNGKENSYRFMSAVNSLSMLKLGTLRTPEGPSLSDDPETMPDIGRYADEPLKDKAAVLLYVCDELR